MEAQIDAEHELAPNRDEVSGAGPRRIPSPKWRELIKKVWEADPLLCPRCSREMRIVALIDDRAVIERILRHLGLWEQGGKPPVNPVDSERGRTRSGMIFSSCRSAGRATRRPAGVHAVG